MRRASELSLIALRPAARVLQRAGRQQRIDERANDGLGAVRGLVRRGRLDVTGDRLRGQDRGREDQSKGHGDERQPGAGAVRRAGLPTAGLVVVVVAQGRLRVRNSGAKIPPAPLRRPWRGRARQSPSRRSRASWDLGHPPFRAAPFLSPGRGTCAIIRKPSTTGTLGRGVAQLGSAHRSGR